MKGKPAMFLGFNLQSLYSYIYFVCSPLGGKSESISVMLQLEREFNCTRYTLVNVSGFGSSKFLKILMYTRQNLVQLEIHSLKLT